MKNILLHLADDARREARLTLALDLAAAHDARLVGYYVVPTMPYSGFAMAQAPISVIEGMRQDALAKAGQAADWFNQACARQGVAAEYRTGEGDAVALLTDASRAADVVLVGQKERDGSGAAGTPAIAEALVLSAACPVLVVPYAGSFAGIGRRVLIAWNDSREASRAVRDALPLLRRAAQVMLLTVNPAADQQIPGAEIAAYLAHHGVTVEASQTVAKDIDIADVLVSSLADRSADLLVMGAWGHSRFRELVLGGVTRDVLKQATVPVLMSH
ncbi:MAG TPA: universal stress protein [Candidatus Sulfotelmatobacter sp.]|nr:universal stress protein [Candidatus Sulfotelmatobacter sp.]